ncbi:PREDICTED: uncharacterized protein LOC105463008 [Wasmannia auropunctata]|uniref:uncharacterized protein LOC105463008 n=1 Tax=Wasmannia auropunctata TaxID=64793 RepID=UPI0005ED8BDE|nr:PREDICTED: uncharacterized protein LOC105463008 [Wasmannia auropunctata]XP_011708301.1 PREDICTED: uncharacterized protein LOC105463008 [Wasmannia auropunctata]
MATSRSLCCIGVSFATRIIGAYTMSTSILLINVLVSSFFSRDSDDDFFESVKTWAILGLNWMQAIQRYTQLQKKAQAALICFLIYAVSFLVASGYLTIGSLSKRHTSAVPWMYLQMISVIDQTVSLSNHIIHDQQSTLYLWYTTVCSVYLILSVYFWMVVESARNQWYNERNRIANCEPSMLDFELAITPTSSDLKSPSFLSQNFSMFESPRPSTILPK